MSSNNKIIQAVFLDLQGTLGGEGLGDIRDFAFYANAISGIKLLNQAGILAIIVTNQSHISKGDFTYEYFLEKMEKLKSEVTAAGGRIDAVYCCPHQPKDNCACMKPLPGLLLRAQEDFHLNFSSGYVVGDTGAWDMVLARSVGCKAVLVRTGLGESSLKEYRHTWANINPDYIADDVLDAAQWIVTQDATISCNCR